MTTHTPIESRITDELAADLFNPQLTSLEICRLHRINLLELAAVLETPWFQQNADALERAEQRRAAALAPDRRERALTTLDAIASQEPTTPTRTECVRRAASAVLRQTTKSEPQASARAIPEEPTAPKDPTPNTNNTQATPDTQSPPDQSQIRNPQPAPPANQPPESPEPLRNLRVENAPSPSALSA